MCFSQEYNADATNPVAKREKKKPDGVAPATPNTEHAGQAGDRGRSGVISAFPSVLGVLSFIENILLSF